MGGSRCYRLNGRVRRVQTHLREGLLDAVLGQHASPLAEHAAEFRKKRPDRLD